MHSTRTPGKPAPVNANVINRDLHPLRNFGRSSFGTCHHGCDSDFSCVAG